MYLYKFPNLYYFWKPKGEIFGNRAYFWKPSIKKPPPRVPCGGGKCKKNCLSLYGFISKGIDKPAKEVQTFLGIEDLAGYV